MNLKRILYLDLLALIPGVRAKSPESIDPQNFWFVRILALIAGHERKQKKIRSRALDTAHYRPGRYYRWISANRLWRGPFYVLSNHWRRDLLKVTNTLAAIVKTNASLTKGLEAAAREENRLRRQLGAVQLAGLLQACAVGVAFLFMGLYITFNSYEFLTLQAVAIFIVFCFMGMLSALFLLFRYRPEEALFLALRDHLAAGRPLSEAMRGMRRFFPSFYADLVKAGEDSGRLAECLDQLSGDTLQNIRLNRTLKVFFLYLGGVLCVQLLILTFIAIKVYPVLEEIVAEYGGAPALPMRIIDNIRDALFSSQCYNEMSIYVRTSVRINTLYAAGGIALFLTACFIVVRIRRRALFTRPVMSLLAFLPGLRGLVVQQNLAVTAFVLEKLLRAGVPLDQAVQSAAETSLNPLYRRWLMNVRARLLQGETFADAVEQESSVLLVPKAFRGFLSIGERSGMLPDTLARIGELYRNAVDKKARMLVDVILPFGVIGLGFLTLFMELAFFLNLVNVYDTMM